MRACQNPAHAFPATIRNQISPNTRESTITSVAALLRPFDIAADLWRKQEALGPAAPDVQPKEVLDLATKLQLEIMREAARIPAKNTADIAAKEKIAGHMERVLDGALDEDGLPITAGLRKSITADLVSFGRIVLFKQVQAA